MPFTEDSLVQKTTADYLEQNLGWKSVYAYNNEFLCVRELWALSTMIAIPAGHPAASILVVSCPKTSRISSR